MALYEAVIIESGDEIATIRHLRRFNDDSISQLRSAIAARNPVVAIASEDHSLELDDCEGRKSQHHRFAEAIDGLLALGNTLELRYRPSHTDRPEVVTRDMLKNAMQSELIRLQQEHD